MLTLNQLHNLPQKAVREGFGEGLLEIARKDSRVVALCADLRESLRLVEFAKELPKQFFEIGVAEQNMLGIAAGLAIAGKIPFATSFAAFNPGRNWDQLRVSVAYSQANVKIIGSHAGIGVGPDGATHQALEDVAITRVLPNMTVLVPTDAQEMKNMLPQVIKHLGPVYIRFGRESLPILTQEGKFEIGKAYKLTSGKDLTIIACGPMVYESLLAEQRLKNKYSLEVIASPTINPLDTETILKSAKKTKAVIVAEDAQRAGGLGGAVAEMLAENYPVPVFRIGVKERFGQSGTTEELRKEYELTADDIMKLVPKVIRRKL